MGYTTEFDGVVQIDPPLNEYETSFLEDFSNTRRMRRTSSPLYVRGPGYKGQDKDLDVLDSNSPPADQPGLWCQWVPGFKGEYIEWNGMEKFYYAAGWMKYLVENLLAPSARGYIDAHISEDPRLTQFTADHVVNGEIDAYGEDHDDRWQLIVENNVVKVRRAVVSFSEPEDV